MLNNMKIEHVAIASNSVEDSDKFFINLLGLKKTRSFIVSADLMVQFFNVDKEQQIIRYENDTLSFEVFITNDDSKSKDIFSHICLVVENHEGFIEKSRSLGFEVIKVPRKSGEGYYLFIKDFFGNLYEIK
jgi:catechol 2,3-dioxygenase-like lactoylglutathione lyase family enzyme